MDFIQISEQRIDLEYVSTYHLLKDNGDVSAQIRFEMQPSGQKFGVRVAPTKHAELIMSWLDKHFQVRKIEVTESVTEHKPVLWVNNCIAP